MISESLAPNLTLQWDGQSWSVSSPVSSHRLRAGFSFSVPLPAEAILPEEEPLRLQLFPAGTMLFIRLATPRDPAFFLPFEQAHGLDKLHRGMSGGHYLPVKLEAGFYIIRSSPAVGWSADDCTCVFPHTGRRHPSLNQAAKDALRAHTDSQAAAMNVFDGVFFVHDGLLSKIDFQRRHVAYGEPLPTRPDPGANTAELPFGG